MRYFILALSLAVAPAAWAEPVYRWIDENGVLNYTNNPSRVPPGVNAETTDGDEITVVASSSAVSSERAAPVSLTADILTPDERARADYWRSAFRDAHARIAWLEQAVKLDKQWLQAQGMPVRFSRGRGYRASPDSGDLDLGQRLEWNLASLKRARAELDELERAASREAVPREWRQP